jgi:phosphoenolpyruvate-protein phosphotransferase (PTS system enzyme I)
LSFSVHGIPVSAQGGVAIGRAVRVVSIRASTPHYFVQTSEVAGELARMKVARDAVLDDMQRLQLSLAEHSHKDAPQELAAIMDVHIMLLQDVSLIAGIEQFIAERHYNAEWALTSQLEILAAQFDEMHDSYMRERKADLEQVAERLLLQMRGQTRVIHPPALQIGTVQDTPLVLIAHDLSPSDMLQFKSSAAAGVFVGFVTDVGGKTSHTAIVARSMGIPAIVGAKSASALVRQDDWVIVDATSGVLIVNPSASILAEYQLRQTQYQQDQAEAGDYKHTALLAADGTRIEVLANIESPGDAAIALAAGAEGIGLFRTEFLFMGRSTLPTEDEQYEAYREVVQTMQGLPVTIRTIDIGADKPLDAAHSSALQQEAHLNPALGLRAIRWCLSEPAMFQTQLRALLRAAVHGRIEVLIPMLAHETEIKQCMLHIDRARLQLDARAIAHGDISVGAMIEVPAAALIVPTFLHYFDFLSLGTNDLIQYTLAVDRADEAVAHLYDSHHPAVQFLIASVIGQCVRAKKSISVCGEMAGDENHAKLLLTMGLRKFSMHPSQISNFKKFVNLQIK